MNIRIIKDIPMEDVNYICEIYKNEEWFKLNCIGRGASGKVYEYKDYAVKLFKRNKRNNDIKILEYLQGKVSCIPTLFAIIDERILIMNRIKGITVYQYIYQNEKNFIHPDFNKLYRQALNEIIKTGYSPKDLHEENVMIDQYGKPVIVDVGSFEKLDGDFNLEDDVDAMWSVEVICGGIDTYLNRKTRKKKAIAG